jgi:hypothetical protein
MEIKIGDVFFWNNDAYGKILVKCSRLPQRGMIEYRFDFLQKFDDSHLSKKDYWEYPADHSSLTQLKKLDENCKKIYNVLYGSK